MTAQLNCRFARVGNALYPENHLSLELYILSFAKLITACVSHVLTLVNMLRKQTEASRPSHLYRTTR